MAKDIKTVWTVIHGDPVSLTRDIEATFKLFPEMITLNEYDARHYLKHKLDNIGKVVKRTAYVEIDGQGFGRVFLMDCHHQPYEFGPYNRAEIERDSELAKIKEQALAKLTDKEKVALGL